MVVDYLPKGSLEKEQKGGARLLSEEKTWQVTSICGLKHEKKLEDSREFQ